MTRFVIVTDDAQPSELHEAITHLWAKRNRAVIASTRDEIEADVDELLDLLAAKATRPGQADALNSGAR